MERFESVLVSGFALLALVSAIDLYAALSHLVSEKTSELGLRLALATSGSRILLRVVEIYQAHSRQFPISFKPSARVCSNKRTRWRECSNSWMSAQTSACQGSSWTEDSPQLAQRVCSLRAW